MVNLFASPVSIAEYITALIIVNLFKTCISVAVMALICLWFYDYNIAPNLILLAPFMLVLGFAAIALGVLVTGLIFRYTTKVQGFAWSFAGVLMPVSCVFYPLASLSPFMRRIAWLLPTTHAFEGMRQAVTASTFSPLHLAWGLGLDILYIALAAIAFSRLFAAARRRGLLVKMA
jgi:ABC-2 type transport system permease protein